MRSAPSPLSSMIMILLLTSSVGAQGNAPGSPQPVVTPSPPGLKSAVQESASLPQGEKRADLDARLYLAIIERLGSPYLDGGTGDGGYDCSGLIWRVFTTAGIELKRTSARILWEELPQASPDERDEFGTLVFFNDLNHVGIVRDSWSFYHASTSQGVTRSFFTDYWIERIMGYRRIPVKLSGSQPAGRVEDAGGNDQATPRPPDPPPNSHRGRLQ